MCIEVQRGSGLNRHVLSSSPRTSNYMASCPSYLPYGIQNIVFSTFNLQALAQDVEANDNPRGQHQHLVSTPSCRAAPGWHNKNFQQGSSVEFIACDNLTSVSRLTADGVY